MLALSIFEASLCECGCGRWAAESQDPDMDGWYEVDVSTVCQVRATLDQYQRDNQGEAENPGQILRVINTREDRQ